jgi:hypothetical protein
MFAGAHNTNASRHILMHLNSQIVASHLTQMDSCVLHNGL